MDHVTEVSGGPRCRGPIEDGGTYRRRVGPLEGGRREGGERRPARYRLSTRPFPSARREAASGRGRGAGRFAEDAGFTRFRVMVFSVMRGSAEPKERAPLQDAVPAVWQPEQGLDGRF